MKKIILFLLFATASLSAAPKAVIFDWGNVLATPDRNVVVQFLCESFQLSKSEFEEANLEKRVAMKAGKSDVDFWLEFAEKKKINLGKEWPEAYRCAIKNSIGVDAKMYVLVEELKKKQIVVGLLSNIDSHYVNLIRDYGLYEPFEPCLLSYEMGVEKPDPQAYQMLLDKMAYSPDEIVFIDDKEENIEAAKKAGLDGIVFVSEEQVRAELVRRGLR